MGKIELEFWPVERLQRHHRSLRKNERHVDRMAGSIQEYGFLVPVLATRGLSATMTIRP